MRATQLHYFFGEPIGPVALTVEDDDAVRRHQQTVKHAKSWSRTAACVRRERRAPKLRSVA